MTTTVSTRRHRISQGLAIASWMAVLQAAAQPVTSKSLSDPPSEAALRQALSPYRMILNSVKAPARAKPAAVPASSNVQPSTATAATRQSAPTISGGSAHSAATSAAPADVPVGSQGGDEQSSPLAVSAPAALPAAAPAAGPAPSPLVALRQDTPELPASLLRQGGRGTVKVAFKVNQEGSTADVHVLSSTNSRFNAAAVAAVGKWRFRPIEAPRPVEVDLVFETE